MPEAQGLTVADTVRKLFDGGELRDAIDLLGSLLAHGPAELADFDKAVESMRERLERLERLGVLLADRAAQESRILSKSSTAMGQAMREAKDALLACRAPEGNATVRAERQRVIGMLADLLEGLADTDGLRVRWLAQSIADLHGPLPQGGAAGVLPFGRRPGKDRK